MKIKYLAALFILLSVLIGCGYSVIPETIEGFTIYTVSFECNGGSYVPSQSVNSGKKAARPADPAKSGCAFDGWYGNPELTMAYDFSTPVSKKITLYAKWNDVPSPIPTHIVSFDSNGGSYVAPQIVKEGDKATKPTDPDHPKSDYTLDNWYDKDGLVYDFSTPVTTDIKLTAEWREIPPNTYLVTFDSNGGSYIDPQIVNSGGKATKPNPDPTRDGYTFVNWYSNSGMTTVYNFSTPVTKGIKLYAKWNAITYVVIFDSNGGSSVPIQTVKWGDRATRPQNPTKSGYTFDNWYTILGSVYDFSTPVIGDMTLYAGWNVAPPAVTLNSVTADGSESQTTTQLTLTFSAVITDLAAGDITLIGITGLSKGTLSGSGPTYTLPISGFTTGGTLSVSVSKSGFNISGSPKNVTIYYYIKVTSVTLNKASISLPINGTETLTAVITPSNATNQKVTWSNGDKDSVATVESGKVTAVAPGTAIITVTTVDGNLTATCTVTVIATVYNESTWNDALTAIKNGGNGTTGNPKTYTIEVVGDVGVPGSVENSFGNVSNVVVEFTGKGKLYLTSRGSLLTIDSSQTGHIDSHDLTLQGLNIGQNNSEQGNNAPLVKVNASGTLKLFNGTISDNRNTNFWSIFDDDGIGVAVLGTFTMTGGTISGNIGPLQGGGVRVEGSGIFTMAGGTISGNSSFAGGGVKVGGSGIFTMTGGTISGNTAWSGGGVRVDGNGTFTMTGGTISGNTSELNSGGGVSLVDKVTFDKSGNSIIYGKDVVSTLQNVTYDDNYLGHAISWLDEEGGYAVHFICNKSLMKGDDISTSMPRPTVYGQTLNNWTKW